MTELAEKTFIGLVTLVVGLRCAFEFFVKWRTQRRLSSLAMFFVCLCLLLTSIPLFEKVPKEWLFVFRYLNAAVLGFLLWSILRVHEVQIGRRMRIENNEELNEWRERNKEYLDQLEARRTKSK